MRLSRNFPLLAVSVVLAALVVIGCDRQPATTQTIKAAPTTQLTIGNKTYTVEIAANDADREHGLMNRSSMPSDHGMIFVFPEEEVASFWMENTLIPLDIVFADHTGRVVSINTMKALDLHTTSSIFPAKYAIELNAGSNKDSGVQIGDTMHIPPGVDQQLPK